MVVHLAVVFNDEFNFASATAVLHAPHLAHREVKAYPGCSGMLGGIRDSFLRDPIDVGAKRGRKAFEVPGNPHLETGLPPAKAVPSGDQALHAGRQSQLFDVRRGVPVLIVTFIAVLELAKETLIDITQAEAFAPIYVRLAYAPT